MSVRVGEMAWERIPEGCNYDAHGGRVYDTEDVDGATSVERHLKCVDMRGRQLRFSTINEADVDVHLVEPANEVFVRSLVRFMAAELAKSKGGWTGRDRLLLLAIHSLAAIS